MPEASGIEVASDTVLGGIKTGYQESTTDKNYAVRIFDGKAYVVVPWSDTTYEDATTSKAGLMSTTDKACLDSLKKYSEETLTFTSGTTTFTKTILVKNEDNQ